MIVICEECEYREVCHAVDKKAYCDMDYDDCLEDYYE